MKWIKRTLIICGVLWASVAILLSQEKQEEFPAIGQATVDLPTKDLRFNDVAPAWESRLGGFADYIFFNQVLADSSPAAAARLLRKLMSENNHLVSTLASSHSDSSYDYHIELPDGTHLLPTPGLEARLVKNSQKNTPALSPFLETTVAIVQFSRDRLSADELLAFFDLGVKPYAHLKNSSVICRLPSRNLEKIARLSFVRWIGEYRPEFKYVAPFISSASSFVYVFPLGKGEATMVQDLRQHAFEVVGYDSIANVFVVKSRANAHLLLAELDWVRKIEAVHEIGDAALSANFQPRDSRELVSSPYVTPYRGSRVVVGIYDTGIRTNHAAFSGRIVQGDNDGNGHGTHVAGIIGASDIDGETFQGVAPLARLYALNFSLHTVSDAYTTFEDNAIHLVNNSWFFLNPSGEPLFTYDTNTEFIDSYADDKAIGLGNGTFRKPLALIFVGGNSGSLGSHTITNPGTGKNVLSIGAIDYTLDGEAGLGKRAYYSSVGPTQEGRLKPDLVAPGGTAGTNDPSGFKAQNGVVSTNAFGPLDEADLYWPTNDQYVRLKGTSMAAPHVTGAAALAIDYWESKGWDWTLVDLKAHLINNAIPIKENDGSPLSGYANTRVGYGLLNALSTIAAYDDETKTVLWGKGYVVETSNVIDDWTFEVPANSKALIATMAYSDLPGKDLQDNLDLILIAPGGARYKHLLPLNVMAESPLEKVVVTSPLAGTWTARVEYKSWPNDPLTISSQQYTVVAAVQLQTPALSVVVSNKNLEVRPGDTIDLQVSVKNIGGYIAAGVAVYLEDVARKFSGEVNQGKFVGNLVHKDAARTVTYKIGAPVSSGSYELTLTAEGMNYELNSASERLTINVSPGPPDKEFKITNLHPLEYSIANLNVGDPYYIDRSWRITKIPQDFQGLIWIKTSANDYGRVDLNFSFDVNQEGKIYVAYDPALEPPDWLRSAYTETGKSLEVENISQERLNLWERKFAVGAVALGDNQGTYGSAMYVVLLRPAGAPEEQPAATLTLPRDLSAVSGTIAKVPIFVTTSNNIKLAQFTVEFNANALTYKGVQTGADVSGFSVTVDNADPPFPPKAPGTTDNVLVQISSSSDSFTGANREIAILEFDVMPTDQSRTTTLAFDEDTTHTFLTTTDQNDIRGSDLTFENGNITTLPVRYILSGNIHYLQNAQPVSDATLWLLSSTGKEQSVSSTAAGAYQFPQLPQDTYLLYPSKIGDSRDAISGTDASWILQYLSFTRTLNSDQILAADVVRDGVVDGADALGILRYLVAKPNSGQTGNWTFAPPSAQIVLDRHLTQNFGAYLLGDVNSSWGVNASVVATDLSEIINGGINRAANLRGGHSPIDTRAIASTESRIVHHELQIEIGQRFFVPVNIEAVESPGLNALVFTLRFDSSLCQYDGFELTALSKEFWGIDHQLADGTVRIALASPRSIDTLGEFLRLHFLAMPTADALVSEKQTRIGLENILMDDFRITDVDLARIQIVNPHALTKKPMSFHLFQNYPNPFNDGTEITYAIPHFASTPVWVELKIFDARGRLIRILESDVATAGVHKRRWDGKDAFGYPVASGVYFYSIRVADFQAVRTMVYLK